ncbi:MAG: glycosyltransferase family A protein [Candidatus Omnitrophota bacterium]
MGKPYFSVIIPTYNRSQFLKTAIESVLNQTFKDFELIIIDDGSQDNTYNLVKSFKDTRIIYKKQEHQGVSSSRNQGIILSRAEIIAFLDSDDRFKPQKLELAAEYIEKFPDIRIFHTEELWYQRKKLLNQKKIHKKPDGFVFKNSLKLCCISLSTVVTKKSLFKEVGLFDETLPACEDYELWLRACVKYPVKLIPYILTLKEGGHSDQLSKKYIAMDTFRIYAIDKLLKSKKITLTPEQRENAIKELKKKCLIYIKGAKKRNKTKEVESYSTLMQSYS